MDSTLSRIPAALDTWPRWAAHRRRIESLLQQASRAAGDRLLVLGAGNCNDLDLRSLEEHFAEIHLVDLNREALLAAMARQSPLHADRIFLHAPCDLSGIMSATNSDPATSIRSHAVSFGTRFEVVLSAGLLTQMFQAVEDLRLDSQTTLDLVLALRRRHLELLFQFAQPGGAFVLITDVVSTATAPELTTCSEESLEALLTVLIDSLNFFTGANPAAIWGELTGDPAFVAGTKSLECHAPWLWPLTASHDYLTWGVTVRTAVGADVHG